MITRSPAPATHHVAGKAILIGEHFVVYGAPAVAVALPNAVQIQATDAAYTSLRIPQWNLEVLPNAEGDELCRALHALLRVLPPCRPVQLTAHLHLPSGVGLGSSASLGVAVLQALDTWNGWALDKMAQYEHVFAWESVFHGTPSGFDHAAALHQGLTRFRRFEPSPIEQIPLRQPLHLVIAQVEDGASTKTMVDGVRHWRDEHPARFAELLQRAEDRAQKLIPALHQGELLTIGEILQENQRDLQEIGVSTTALDLACERAQNAGAFGAKLIGAGGGGCMLALADAQNIAEVEKALKASARMTLPLHLTPSF